MRYFSWKSVNSSSILASKKKIMDPTHHYFSIPVLNPEPGVATLSAYADFVKCKKKASHYEGLLKYFVVYNFDSLQEHGIDPLHGCGLMAVDSYRDVERKLTLISREELSHLNATILLQGEELEKLKTTPMKSKGKKKKGKQAEIKKMTLSSAAAASASASATPFDQVNDHYDATEADEVTELSAIEIVPGATNNAEEALEDEITASAAPQTSYQAAAIPVIVETNDQNPTAQLAVISTVSTAGQDNTDSIANILIREFGAFRLQVEQERREMAAERRSAADERLKLADERDSLNRRIETLIFSIDDIHRQCRDNILLIIKDHEQAAAEWNKERASWLKKQFEFNEALKLTEENLRISQKTIDRLRCQYEELQRSMTLRR